jgi:hypothetical protein
MRVTATPSEVAGALEKTPPGSLDAQRERFRGYGVMGLPFESGHVLGLRRFPVSSIGPGYTSIWHRSPDGRWSFWSTTAPEVSCARYTGEISDDTRETAIRLAWPEHYRLTITADDPSLSWEVTFAATPASRALSALAQRMPGQFLASENVLRILGPVAGTMLGAGRLALTGTMPNRQTFHLVPSHVWMVTASRAQLEATDFGKPAPLPRQATIGDFRIPQKGLLAVGNLDADVFSPARHSTRTARG